MRSRVQALSGEVRGEWDEQERTIACSAPVKRRSLGGGRQPISYRLNDQPNLVTGTICPIPLPPTFAKATLPEVLLWWLSPSFRSAPPPMAPMLLLPLLHCLASIASSSRP